MSLDLLKDREIREVYVSEDDGDMFFVTDGGIVRVSLEGDCCSQSWFSDIYNFDALLGRVSEAKEIDLPDYDVDDMRSRQEVDSAYGIAVSTNKGTAKIVFRNSSNGYYGGYINSVQIVTTSLDEMKRITDDWKA